MVERELNAVELDERVLLDLVRSTDPVGVLSIYIDAHSGAPDPGSRSWAIDLDNRLAELKRRIADNGAPELEDALRQALVRIGPLLERQIDPRSSGRGRALFVWLDRLEVMSFSSQMRLPNRVVLDTSPFVHPLLELLDLGRPAGVALTAGDQVELLDWRLGELRTLARIAPEAPDPERQAPGPVSTMPPAPSRSHPGASCAPGANASDGAACSCVPPPRRVGLADERGWEQILVSGDERLTTAFIEELARPAPRSRDPRSAAPHRRCAEEPRRPGRRSVRGRSRTAQPRADATRTRRDLRAWRRPRSVRGPRRAQRGARRASDL